MIFGKSSILSRRKQIWQRRLTPRLETLEARRLLATLTVDTADDVVDGDVSSISALLDASGNDGFISLREAIQAANATAGADAITFDDSLAGVPFNLSLGELIITDELTITGLGASQTIVDAGGQSRVFNITAASGDFLFEGLTVTGGRTTGDKEEGGGVHSDSSGLLTIIRSTISGNSTNGKFSFGGAIKARGDISLIDSVISDNSTLGESSPGGGIQSRGNVSLVDSIVSENATSAGGSDGGGIFVNGGDVRIISSTISENSTAGNNANGGGIFAAGNLSLKDSIVSENSTAGERSPGGGIWALGDVSLTNSTISENFTTGQEANGGGIFTAGNESDLSLVDSIISGNSTTGLLAYGGGIFSQGDVSIERSEISGNSSVRNGGGIHADGNVSLAGSTIFRNSSGSVGGISAGGDVSLTDSTILGHPDAGTGRGIFSQGDVNLTNSMVFGHTTDGPGGGISASGNVTLVTSAVSGNFSGSSNIGGGGIFADGDVTLSSSTVSGNSTTGESAGGGGIRGRTVTLTNSTISGNSTTARGGGIGAERIILTNSTVTGNSTTGNYAVAGIWARIEAIISSSIVAGNTNSAKSAFSDIAGGALTVDRSLIGNNRGTDLAEAQTPDADGNLIGSSAGAGIIDALLAPLSDYGGPTLTHALLSGSPAIDAGRNPSMLDFDQRGEPYVRVLGGRIDIGAFEGTVELQPITLVVTTADDELDAQLDLNDLSLREAIEMVNRKPGPDEIRFDDTLAGLPINLSMGQLSISEELSIIGLGPSYTTIDAQGGSRIFNITTNGGNFLFEGLTLTGGHENSSGGAIRSESSGQLTISDSVISGNSTEGLNAGGGGISARDIAVINSTISDNSTSGDQASGGGINAEVLTVVDSTISGNFTAGEFARGGGIYAQADVSLTGSTLAENFTSGARSAGGGLFTDDHVSLIDSRVTGNSTAGDNANGGGIFADDLTVTDSIVFGNSTAGSAASGGGLFAQGDAVLTNSLVSENSTSGDSAEGGGVYAAGNAILIESIVSGNTTLGSLANGAGVSVGGNVGLTNSTVSGNSTVGYLAGGGGIHAGGNVSLAGSEILGNSVDGDFAEGGGIWAFRNISLTRSTVSDNHTRGRLAHGGGIFALGGDSLVSLTESNISENSTEGFGASGGGIYGRNVSLNDSTVSGNSTTGEDADGGGIYARDVTLASSTISGNSATGSGGGVDVANIRLTDSSVSGNSTQGEYSVGGGIYADGNVTLIGSTISGNSTSGEYANGGGIYSESGSVNIKNSTITGNSTSGIHAGGGGLFAYAGNVSIVSSIIAGNTAYANQMPDMRSTGSPTVRHSLIGDNPGAWLVEAQTPDADGNLIGSSAGGGIIDPMLRLLADNSGPTETHALLPGSPAINSGSNPDGLEFDQRGEPFVRVFGGAPDMGAVELQPSHITGLFVNSTLWNDAFRENLGEFGFSLIGEPAGPLPLSWSRLDQISITVVGDASEMPPTGLRLFGAVHGTYAFDAGRFQYDSDSRTATWVLDSALHPNGIEADSLSVVLDNFTFSFDILPGDGNRNGIVDIRDVQALRIAHLASIGEAGYQPELDFDGSGLIDLRDLQILRENLLNKLPKQLPRPVLASLPHLEDAQPLAVTRRNSRHDQIFATLTDDFVFDKPDLFGHE